jgi:hypothetical protein
MKIVGRAIAMAVALTLLFTGPLATFAAAQQPAQPPQPGLMQETVKTTESDTTAYDVGAGFANLFYVPGKVAVCGLGILAGGGLLVLTLGSGYKAAAGAGREGCGGKWVLRGDDLRPDPVMPGDQDKLQ